MSTITPKTEFQSLSFEAVLAGLYDPDAANPIAVEIGRLVKGYVANFERYVERLGRVPADILRLRPRWPIEAVAMQLATNCIREMVREKA